MDKDRIEFEHIATILMDEDVINSGLHIEIIWSALNYAKSNPTASIADCMAHGYGEWIK